ncbi:hypothetical protein Anas_07647 [Armadillidium nasatum]|uniref:WAP domain-containing protein n=1 Tax=Armadillidium nasatum TaxID=96803 RepID=A0A5N5SQI9_9CRUS|nr:hypothetical protein Anas_07647 [Armadillidium nasatum]
MKTAVILLCFSVFLISVEGRSQPVIPQCPRDNLMHGPRINCPFRCSSDDDCPGSQLCCHVSYCLNRSCTKPTYVPYNPDFKLITPD